MNSISWALRKRVAWRFTAHFRTQQPPKHVDGSVDVFKDRGSTPLASTFKKTTGLSACNDRLLGGDLAFLLSVRTDKSWSCVDKVDGVDGVETGLIMSELIPKHGGYRKLKSFQVAQLVYDVTVRFCDKYISKRSRTHDQMVQAARSGVQNIAEGSQASATSKKTELKLTQVARASLEELKLDYEDFLRQRGLKQWERGNPLRQVLIDRRCETADQVAAWVVEAAKKSGQNGQGGQDAEALMVSTRSTKSTDLYPEISANAALVLLAVACALLDRQVASLAADFEKEGGFTERLYRVRTANRRNNR